MCVAAIAFNINQTYPFVLIHNRDEYLTRPTAPLELDKQGIASGIDLQAGGRWLGVTHSARKSGFALVTNHRFGKDQRFPGKRSRGELVSEFLEEGFTAAESIELLTPRAPEYQPFVFVAGDWNSLHYYHSVTQASGAVDSGVFGVSNGDPRVVWPKTARLQAGLKNILSAPLDEKRMVQNLFLLLADKQKPADSELPSTGVPLELERELSSIFVELPQYGTRISTLVLLDASGMVRMWERTFTRGKSAKDRQLQLTL